MAIVIWAILLLYPLVQVALFARVSPTKALVGGYVFGFMVLPNRVYAPFTSETVSDVFGLMLYDGAIITKPLVLAIGALAGSLLYCRGAWQQFRLHWLDFSVLLWASAVACSVFVNRLPILEALSSVLYSSVIWGVPWFLARVFIRSQVARFETLQVMAWSSVSAGPLLLLEFIAKPFVYGLVYGPQPYQMVGHVRYVGYRPVLFFEDGNQLGVWLAVSATAALAIFLAVGASRRVGDGDAPVNARFHSLLVSLTFGLLLLVQSMGAVILGVFAVLWQVIAGRMQVKWLVAGLVVLAMVYAGARVTGVVDARQIVESSPVAAKVKQVLKATGRGSLGWRLKVEEQALARAAEKPVWGAGVTDWWRGLSYRPWGIWPLIFGAYGVFGLLTSLSIWLGPALVWHLKRGPRWIRSPHGRIELGCVSVCVILAMDGALNSMLPVMGLLCCGAVVGACLEQDHGDDF